MLVPRWRRIAVTVSAEPPVAEIANTSVSAAAGWGRPVEAISAVASTPCERSSVAASSAAKRELPMPRKSTRRALPASGRERLEVGRRLAEHPRRCHARRRRRAPGAGQPSCRHQPAHAAHRRVHPVGHERGGVGELVGLLLDLERPQEAARRPARSLPGRPPGPARSTPRSRRRGRVAGRARHTGRGGRTTAAWPPRRAARRPGATARPPAWSARPRGRGRPAGRRRCAAPGRCGSRRAPAGARPAAAGDSSAASSARIRGR